MSLDAFLERATIEFGATPAEVSFFRALAGPVAMHGVAWINESHGFASSLAAVSTLLGSMREAGRPEHDVEVLLIEAGRETNESLHEAVAAAAASLPDPEQRRRTWAQAANEWIRAREQGRATGLVALRIRASREAFLGVSSKINRAVTRISQPTRGEAPLVVVNLATTLRSCGQEP